MIFNSYAWFPMESIIDHHLSIFKEKDENKQRFGESSPLMGYLITISRKNILVYSAQLGSLNYECGVVSKKRAFVECFLYHSTFLDILIKSKINKIEGALIIIICENSNEILDIPISMDDTSDGEIIKKKFRVVSDMGKIDPPDILNRGDLVHVLFIDMEWGRCVYLFDKICQNL